MKHKQKVKIARKLLSKTEKLNKTPIFQSNGWEQRKLSKVGKKNNMPKLSTLTK